MANQIIARGKVQRHPNLGWHLFDPRRDQWVGFDGWAKQYEGQTLTISIEEPEEETKPIKAEAIPVMA